MNPTHPNELEKYAHLLEEARQIHGVSLARDAWRRLRRSWSATASLVFLACLALLAMLTPLLPLQPPRTIHSAHPGMPSRQFLAPSLAPAPPLVPPMGESDQERDDAQRLQAALREGFGELDVFSAALLRARVALFNEWSIPSVCGTDKLGRDLLSRICWGTRISCAVGLIATLVSLAIGVTYGAVSGYLGGWIDNIMMRAVDILYSVPFIFIVIFFITIINSEGVLDPVERGLTSLLALVRLAPEGGVRVDRLMIFFVLVGAIYWLTMARVVRGQILSLKNEQFVEAARTLGAGRARIIFHHLVPNILSVVIVYLTLTIPRVILFEAFLSFLGLGVEPPDVSWGLLANEGLQVITPVRTYYWLVLFPSVALAVTLFALNFLGDGLRDALDPRMKHQ